MFDRPLPPRASSLTPASEASRHPADDRTDPCGFGALLARFLDALTATHHPAATIRTRRYQIRQFVAWAAEHDLRRPADVTRRHLEHYQRSLHRHRKADGEPLALCSQQAALLGVRAFFRWLARQHLLLFNPASELELPPRREKLPGGVLSISEAEEVLARVDLEQPLGIRDRAILETLYSTAIRRTELTRVSVSDLDHGRGTLRIRHGKGRKERVVPIGERALLWIRKYEQELRPFLLQRRRENLALDDDAEGILFLSRDGKALSPDALSQRVRTPLLRAAVEGRGCCHLFRHTAATLMLEGGADIRYIQAILGHAELSTTEIYTRVSIPKLKAIHEATHPAALGRSSMGEPGAAGDGRRATGERLAAPSGDGCRETGESKERFPDRKRSEL